MDQLKQHFRPEFLNRIDEFVVFHTLGREQIAKIVKIQLRYLNRRLAQRGMSIKLTEKAELQLAQDGYDPTFGARPLKRVIQQRIENPLAAKILAGEFTDGDHIDIDADSGETFLITKSAGRVEPQLVEG